MRHHRVTTARPAALLAVLALAMAAGCAGEATPSEQPAMTAKAAEAFRIVPEPSFGSTTVSPVQPVRITVTGGKLRSVKLTNDRGDKVAGKLVDGRSRWLATEPLGYGRSYVWKGSATDGSGERYPISGTFRTLAPDELLSASTNVADGGIYPDDLAVVVTFTAAVDDPEVVERALTVVTKPYAAGRWSWSADDRVVSWKPAKKWKAGTKIRLRGKLYGIRTGDGQYGAHDMDTRFSIHAG